MRRIFPFHYTISRAKSKERLFLKLTLIFSAQEKAEDKPSSAAVSKAGVKFFRLVFLPKANACSCPRPFEVF